VPGPRREGRRPGPGPAAGRTPNHRTRFRYYLGVNGLNCQGARAPRGSGTASAMAGWRHHGQWQCHSIGPLGQCRVHSSAQCHCQRSRWYLVIANRSKATARRYEDHAAPRLQATRECDHAVVLCTRRRQWRRSRARSHRPVVITHVARQCWAAPALVVGGRSFPPTRVNIIRHGNGIVDRRLPLLWRKHVIHRAHREESGRD